MAESNGSAITHDFLSVSPYNWRMLYNIFSIMAPVLICATAGFFWARKGYAFDAEFVSRLVINIGAPCLMLSTLSSVQLDFEAFKRTAMACVLVAVVMTALGVMVPRLLGQDVRAYLPSFVFPNVGNMGLPICMLAFGDHGLALGLAFFMVLSIAHFPVATLMAGGKEAGGLGAVARMPMLYVVLLAIVMLWQEWHLPVPVANSVRLLGGMAIPLMLLALGVSLARLKVNQWRQALLYSALRIGGGLLAGLAACALLGLEGSERGVVLLQASMPVAVFNYLFAERYRRQPEAVAGLVVMSTLMSFVTLPVLLWWLL
ncbi:AEC family transporter [Oceanospirillaceae bacterium G-43]|uniref:AEC family transporter n=2 Tax=Parathalassolituus penaei TaxID=2997323 RepID=A0A9X3EDY3_9GAMM|nr:AEC family transporter [Parathalassolituus penaei]